MHHKYMRSVRSVFTYVHRIERDIEMVGIVISSSKNRCTQKVCIPYYLHTWCLHYSTSRCTMQSGQTFFCTSRHSAKVQILRNSASTPHDAALYHRKNAELCTHVRNKARQSENEELARTGVHLRSRTRHDKTTSQDQILQPVRSLTWNLAWL